MNTVQVKTLDKDKIKQAADASPTAMATMIALGFKERARANSNLSLIKSQLLKMNEKITDRDYMAFWKALEDAGAGVLVLGRRGGKTRFAWNYSLKQIASLAIEGKDSSFKHLEDKFKTAKEVMHERAEANDVSKGVPKQLSLFTPDNTALDGHRPIKMNVAGADGVFLPVEATEEELVKVLTEFLFMKR